MERCPFWGGVEKQPLPEQRLIILTVQEIPLKMYSP